MMATSKKPAAAKVEIDCEVCRNYTGSAFLFRFGCAKGHAQEKTWTLKRESCPDFSLMSRKEQILKRFDFSATLYGDRDIKKHRSEVRRMVTSMQKTLDSFGKFMTVEQIEAVKKAAHHLAALGDDLELAGRLANQLHKDAEEERQRKEKERRAALVAQVFGGMSNEEAVALCEDLVAFNSTEAIQWLGSHKQMNQVYVLLNAWYDLRDVMHAWRRDRSPVALANAKEHAARCVDELKDTHYSRRDEATWADFEAWRAWHRDVKATLDNISKGGSAQ